MSAEEVYESMTVEVVSLDSIEINNRIRTDLGPREGPESIIGLAQSLMEVGQIQPIVLSGSELKAGGRRFAAALYLQSINETIGSKLEEGDPRRLPLGTILAIQFGELSREMQLRIEIEENTRRKSFSKAEDAIAIKRLQELLGEQMGLAEGQKVHVREVARKAGISAATVSMGLRVAEAIEGGNISLKDKKSISGAYQSLRSQEKLAAKIAELQKNVTAEQLSRNLFCGDAREWIKKIPTGSVDIWSFDPPWGIGVDSYDRQKKYDGDWSDDRDMAKALIEDLVPQMYRTLKDNSWLFAFFGIQFYAEFKDLLIKTGFHVYPVPYIWYKPNKLGAQNDPSRFDINMYEPIFLCAKGEPRIYKQVQGNVLTHDMPPRDDRFHFAQKPVELYVDLLERFSFGNMLVADPTAGSFAVIKAARRLGRQYTACEANKENYDRGIIFINS